jgi:hypothetical protein
MKTAMWVILAGLCSLNLCSCKPMTGLILGVNRNPKLSSRADYLSFINPKYVIDKSNAFYIDRKDYFSLVNEIIQKRNDNFYGVFLNDSTMVPHSGFLEADPSCMGRVKKEIQTAISGGMPETIAEPLFRHYCIRAMVSDKRFYPSSDKITLVFFFSTQQGAIHKKDLQDIQQLYRGNPKIILALISTDDYAGLPSTEKQNS